METKDRQIRFWQIFAGATLMYVIIAIVLLLLHPFSGEAAMQGTLAYVLGGVLGTWLVVAPIAYLMWVRPGQKPHPTEMPAKEERLGTMPRNLMDVNDLKIHYRFSIVFFAFFITAMLIQFVAYVFWSWDGIFSGFWFTMILLGMGLANLASIIWQAQMRPGWNRREKAEWSQRLNRWWILVLSLAAAWLLAVWVLFPRLAPGMSHPLEGMLAAVWLILSALSYLLYVIGYPRLD
jgi:hypothetical protein